MKNSKVTLFISLIFITSLSTTAYSNTTQPNIRLVQSISFPHYPIVLTGRDLLPINGVPISNIRLMSVKDGKLKPIIFQIDKRNENDQFEFNKNKKNTTLDDNDEIVFLAKDTGEKWLSTKPLEDGSFVTEIIFEDPISDITKWVYAVSYRNKFKLPTNTEDQIFYDVKTDTISSKSYKIDFVTDIPFLVNSFHWASSVPNQWHQNVIDSMKVQHHGKLFGMFDFKRTHRDYHSEIVAIKDGPVRVIRRTKNSVHILFGFNSPEIIIDLIAYPNAVFMDIHVNMPFKLGLVLSDLSSHFTVDLSSDPNLPFSMFYSESFPQGVKIDGTMTESKQKINQSGDDWLMLNNDFGALLIGLILDSGLPVTRRVYIMDDITKEDSPEDFKGLFGNAGYSTLGWEHVESGIYHILFGIYVTDTVKPKKAFEILKDAPWRL